MSEQDDRSIAATVRRIDELQSENAELKATLNRVRLANNTAAAHRFDFDHTDQEGPGGKVGGPNDFYNGCRYVVTRVRAALGDQ